MTVDLFDWATRRLARQSDAEEICEALKNELSTCLVFNTMSKLAGLLRYI